jgi:hypothetical protein
VNSGNDASSNPFLGEWHVPVMAGPHRQKLLADLDRARSLNFDTTLPLQSVTGDLVAIDAGFDLLDAAMGGEQ